MNSSHLSSRIAVRVLGVDLTYLERPAASASAMPPLVMLHGIVSSAEGFTRLVEQLADDRRVVALNLPGIDAGTQPRDYTLRGLAVLVRAFLNELGLERPILLGHSHGGTISMQFAAMYRGDLSGMVMLCPAHPFLRRERPLIAFYNSWLGHAAVRGFRYLPETFHSLGFRRLLGPKGRSTSFDFRPYRSSLLHAPTVREVQRIIRTWNEDMDALGAEITAQPVEIPTLFLWGDSDGVVPIATAAPLQACFTRWEMFTLRGVGHLPNDEDTEACSSRMRTWMMWLATGRLR